MSLRKLMSFNYAFAGSGISGKRGDDYEFDAKILPYCAYDYINYLGVTRDICDFKIGGENFLPEPKEREIIFVKESDFEKF